MSFRKHLLHCLIVNTVAGVIPVVFIWLLAPQFKWHFSFEYFKYSFVYAQIIGSLAYLTTAWTWPILERMRPVARWGGLIALLLAVAVVGSLIAGLITMALGWTPPAFYWTQFWTTLKICIAITMQIGIAMEIIEHMRARLYKANLELREKELERERALKLATEAKLAALQSRVHPHFLFNALNSISALIQEDPERADRLVERMAALLRFTLESGQDSLVPLADEIKIVCDYLEIEKARFGDRLVYDIHVPEEALSAQVPPLALQTLVENSVKYAIAPQRTGGEIQIAAKLMNGDVHIEIADTGPGFRLEDVPAGHGMDNLRSRLAHLFPGTANLAVSSQNGRSSVLITLPRTHDHASLSG
jgi:LytS/YehU family sensor histidine kinase